MVHIIKPHQASEYIAQWLPAHPIIIEAGAFDGTDTKRLAHQWPGGTIHAFEPVPEIFERLTTNTQHLPNVYRYQVALSDHTGTAPFHISEKPHKPGVASQAGSLRAPKDRLQYSPLIFPRNIVVATITLAEWSMHHEIQHIDMLWLDMQGHELNVLKSMPSALLNTVKVVHAEVAFIEAYEGQPTYAIVKEWFEKQGFVEVARDFENSTDWFFGNSIFLRKNSHTAV